MRKKELTKVEECDNINKLTARAVREDIEASG